MKVKGHHTVTSFVEVEVSPRDAMAQVKLHVLRQMSAELEIAHDEQLDGLYIDSEGQLCVEVEHRGSHSWTEKRIVAVKPDKKLIDLFRAFDLIAAALRK